MTKFKAAMAIVAMFASLLGTTSASAGDAGFQYWDFAGKGFAKYGLGIGQMAVNDLVLLPDDRMVAAGWVDTPTGRDVLLLRFTPKGELDPTFGSGGVVVADLAQNNDGNSSNDKDEATAIAIQPDGKLVITGKADDGGSNLLVARFNPGGTLDPTFSGDGVDIHHIGAWPEGFDVAVQDDGRIVVAGQYRIGLASEPDWLVLRYLTAGVLDPTFASAGEFTYGVETNLNMASSIAIGPAGQLMVGGSVGGGGAPRVAVARLNQAGVLDATFGVGGVAFGPPIAGRAARTGMALQANRDVLIATTGPSGLYSGLLVTRFKVNGDLDPEFSGDGSVLVDIEPGSTAFVPEVMLNPGGGIVVAGFASTLFDSYMFLAGLTPNGSLDTSFGRNGTQSDRTDDWSPDGSGAVLRGDGTILIAGSTVRVYGSPPVAAVWAYNARDANLGPYSVNFGRGDQRLGASVNRRLVDGLGFPVSFTFHLPSGESCVEMTGKSCWITGLQNGREYSGWVTVEHGSVSGSPSPSGPLRPYLPCDQAIPHRFVDVRWDSFASTSISCIRQLGITRGTSAYYYSPEQSVTREQMAAFLSRLYLATTGTDCPIASTPFTDVSNSFARTDIACIYGLGVTTGTRPDAYSPKNPVSREQMAAFMARFYKTVSGNRCSSSSTPFVDVSRNSFAFDDVACIRQLGITKGTGPDTYSPKNPVSREQMAAFMARLYTTLA